MYWKCFNCINCKSNAIYDLDCRCCGVGLNPFRYFILNERDPVECDYPLFNKKFALIRGKTDILNDVCLIVVELCCLICFL